jgi:hypothetical protein
MRKGIALFTALLFAASMSFASNNDLAYKGITELDTMTEAASGDYVPVYDATTDTVQKMDASNPEVSGNMTFQSTLAAIGREGGASTVSSSSTAVDPTSQAYTVVRKCVGGNSGLDETGVGTRLPNGVPGKIIHLVIIALSTDGSWVITPVTSTVITNITLDAVNESVTLLYLNSTVGWIPISVGEGAAVVYNVKSFTS